jgi:hypothetical protein
MADNKIPSLEQYLNEVSSARHDQLRSAAGAHAENADAFGSMKEHILGLYQGVQSTGAFQDDNGSIFDCIPVHQQPSLRGKQPAKPTALPASAQHAESAAASREAAPKEKLLSAGQRSGNNQHCPEGHIPMRRVRLDEMMRFRDVRQFLRKSPGGDGIPPRTSGYEAPKSRAAHEIAPQVASHKYAHAYQSVPNLGGHTFMNVWQPPVTGTQIFSLAQHWYVGGSGGGLQTAEVGWQVYPQKYGNSQPCLFIYWTADAYQNTGCYNLDCTAFVQTNHIWTFGGTLSPVSIYNGQQYELQVAFYLYQGNWWLYLQGTDAAHAVGYYPTSIDRGGAMASQAAEIDYGGETVGTTNWPPMGSGHFANEGFGKACFQRDIYYFPPSGGATYANLNPSQPSPACYTLVKQNYAAPWNDTIFFGGPGGTGC